MIRTPNDEHAPDFIGDVVVKAMAVLMDTFKNNTLELKKSMNRIGVKFSTLFYPLFKVKIQGMRWMSLLMLPAIPSELRYLAQSLEAMHDDWQTRNARNRYRQIGDHDKYLELRLKYMEVGAEYLDLVGFYWEIGEKKRQSPKKDLNGLSG